VAQDLPAAQPDNLGENMSITSSDTLQQQQLETTNSIALGAGIGLIPLGVLIAMGAITLGLAALARLIIGNAHFFTQQTTSVIILLAGFGVGIGGYFAAIARVLNRVAGWHSAGETRRAAATLWALAVTALVVLVPVILAIVLPQHPAP
jgi:MFS family permease